MFWRLFCTAPATPRALAPPPRAGRLGRGGRVPTSRAAPQSAQWLSRTYVFCIPPRYHLAKTSLTPRSRDVPCPCSWARWASGGGAAVRVGRLRPPGVVSAGPPWPHVATVYVSQRVLCRFVVTRRSSSTVAPRRPLHHSPPPRARVVRVTRSFSPPPPPTTRASWNDVVRQPAVSNTPVAACGRESSPITRLCRQAPMMAKDMHPPHVLVWLLEPRECFFAAYICRT